MAIEGSNNEKVIYDTIWTSRQPYLHTINGYSIPLFIITIISSLFYFEAPLTTVIHFLSMDIFQHLTDGQNIIMIIIPH